MDKTRVRIRFTKQDDLRWISHRDLARLWERLLRRAGLQLAFSQGFHPKPRISFPSALALGIEALDEIVELELIGEVDCDAVRQTISDQTPDGMQILEVVQPDYGLGKAKVSGATYCITIPDASQAETGDRIQTILSQPEIEYQRDEKKTIRVSTNDPDFALKIEGNQLVFAIPNDPQGALRPSELLTLVGLPDILESGQILQRIRLHLRLPEPKPQPET